MKPLKRPQVPGRLASSWFELTQSEQKAVMIVLALFLLGQIVRCWHLAQSP